MLNVSRLILACLAMLGVLASGNGVTAQQRTVIVPTLSQQIDGARIGWIVNDLQGSFGRGQKDGQPVVIFFTSADCNWCKKYIANVFACPTLNTLAGRAHFVITGVALSSEAADLMHALGFDDIPAVSVMLVSPDNKVKEIVRGMGFTDEAGLLGILARAKLAPTPPNRLPQASVALGTYLPQGCGLHAHSEAEKNKMSWPETIIVPGL